MERLKPAARSTGSKVNGVANVIPNNRNAQVLSDTFERLAGLQPAPPVEYSFSCPVQVDSSKVQVARGGEPIEAVYGRKEEDEFPVYSKGAIRTGCPVSTAHYNKVRHPNPNHTPTPNLNPYPNLNPNPNLRLTAPHAIQGRNKVVAFPGLSAGFTLHPELVGAECKNMHGARFRWQGC